MAGFSECGAYESLVSSEGFHRQVRGGYALRQCSAERAKAVDRSQPVPAASIGLAACSHPRSRPRANSSAKAGFPNAAASSSRPSV